MRFWFTLFLIVLVGFFALKSCSNRFTEGLKPRVDQTASASKAAAVPAAVPPPAPVPPPAVVPTFPEMGMPGFRVGGFNGFAGALPAVPPTSAVYTFRNRSLPPPSFFAVTGGSPMGGNSLTVSLDEASNSILIRGSLESVNDMIKSAVALDVVSDEAYVDAWMLFVRGDKVKDFEAAFSISEGGFDMTGSASVSSDGFGVSVPAGPMKLTLQALASRGLVEVVDRPQLRLSSGHHSEVSTGDEVPFPTTTFNNGIASTSIEFKRVGLTFGVDPLFLSGDRVRMDVKAENGLLGPVQKIAGVEIPSISRQSVTSAATLGMDDALVIGGLESVRRERRFGLLGQSEKMQVGRLYVAIMLRSGYPHAKPVIGPGSDLGIDVPGIDGEPGVYDDSLLPPKGWLGDKSPAWLDQEIDKVERRISRIKGRPSK